MTDAEKKLSADTSSNENSESPDSEVLEWHGPVLVRTEEHMSIPWLIRERVRKHPRQTIISRKAQMGSTWRNVSANDFLVEVNQVARGLIALGLQPGDAIAIMSHTRYEWTLLDIAGWSAGLTVVPIYETSSVDQIARILQDADVKLVVTETMVMAQLVQAARNHELGGLQVFSLDNSALMRIVEAGRDVPESEVDRRVENLTINDTATIVYTSGTTGPPKGVVLTHGNFTTLAQNGHEWMPEIALPRNSRLLLFLPLAHVYARFLEVFQLTGRGVLGHTPNTRNLLADLETFRPSYLLAVPRVLEKIYNSADQAAGSGVALKTFRWAAKTAIEYSRALDTEEGPSKALKAQHQLADAMVYRKIKNLLGGNCEYIISGGGPLGERLGHFFRGVGVMVLEGYGLTETVGPLAVNTPRLSKIGTVGPPISTVAVRISDEGEVLVKGPSVFNGYHNMPEETAEAFEGRWFKTGDIGSLDRDGYLQITGRQKEILVTAGGKNVVPTILEDRLRGHPLVSQVVVVGDKRPFVAALVTIDSEMLPGWLKNHNLPAMTVSEAVSHPGVLAALNRAVERANQAVSRAESIRKIKVLTTDFTEANGMLTPSLKVKRAVVLRDFEDEINDIYGGPVRQAGE
ncbi:MAG: AMP-dependent synthetase/ligase [Actinomycetaceae bacterium]|nr:AMP-dependent synthetase/ligase [Actinomycetaceae bacterium]